MLKLDYVNYNLIILFALAFVIGAAIKTVASETITMGFDDYKLAPKEMLYDLNAMQKKFMRAR